MGLRRSLLWIEGIEGSGDISLPRKCGLYDVIRASQPGFCSLKCSKEPLRHGQGGALGLIPAPSPISTRQICIYVLYVNFWTLIKKKNSKILGSESRKKILEEEPLHIRGRWQKDLPRETKWGRPTLVRVEHIQKHNVRQPRILGAPQISIVGMAGS